MVTVTNKVAEALLWVGFFCICLLFLWSVSVDVWYLLTETRYEVMLPFAVTLCMLFAAGVGAVVQVVPVCVTWPHVVPALPDCPCWLTEMMHSKLQLLGCDSSILFY